jgi:hypothetical protein
MRVQQYVYAQWCASVEAEASAEIRLGVASRPVCNNAATDDDNEWGCTVLCGVNYDTKTKKM